MSEVLSYSSIETKKPKIEKQETSQERKERLVILELQQKGITYKTLKLKLEEIKDKKKLLELMPDDEDVKQQVEKLEQELKSKAIVIKVKKWDTLRWICEKEYWEWDISIKILIPKLGYKENIKAWEELPIPLKKYIAKLVKGMTEDLSDDYQTISDDEKIIIQNY